VGPGEPREDDSDSWRILESALDAVVSIDREGRIVRWNPQAERIFGWSAAEAVGKLMRETIVPPQYRQRHQRGFERYLATGVPHILGQRIEVLAVHRDGRDFPVELSIVELASAGRERFSAFIRDLSRERATEAQLDRARRERRSLAESVGRMQPGATVEQTAEGICAAVRTSINADLVAVMLFEPGGILRPLAFSAADGQLSLIWQEMSPAWAAHLIERTRAGPWIELPGEASSPYGDGERWSACTAYAPIPTDDGSAVGLLLAASTGPGNRDRVTGWLPLVSDFAGVASALLTPHLRAGRVAADERGRLEAIIAEHQFVSVFQPIVELESRRITGYEALTRFGDEPPNVVFARAAAIGLGVELELACLQSSLDAGAGLPASSWLSLNVSPDLVASHSRLRDLVEHTARDLEITERMQITDYEGMRTAIQSLGPSVQLAIDDAGAGYASLQHIIELRPSVVKLDIGVIRGVDADPVRQAMVAGIVHFANEIGCTLVGEGVETLDEARTLTELGVPMGQGFLFARPAPVAELLADLH
jgi:PAS domain S-box-containing protein